MVATTPKPGPYDVGPLMTVTAIQWGVEIVFWYLIFQNLLFPGNQQWMADDGFLYTAAGGDPDFGDAQDNFLRLDEDNTGSAAWFGTDPEIVRTRPLITHSGGANLDLNAQFDEFVYNDGTRTRYVGGSFVDRNTDGSGIKRFHEYIYLTDFSGAFAGVAELRLFNNQGIGARPRLPFDGPLIGDHLDTAPYP